MTQLAQKWFFGSKSELFSESGSVSDLEEAIAKSYGRRESRSQGRAQLAYIN